MFVEKKRSWISIVLLGGAALPHIWTRTLIVTLISVVFTVVYREVPALHMSITTTPFVLIGLPLGIFLGFRNNTAYDRFWEGRKFWGSLVNTSRSLTRQILTLIEVQSDATERSEEHVRALEKQMTYALVGFVHALRHQLRGSDPLPTLRRFIPNDRVNRIAHEINIPSAVLHLIAEDVVLARRKHWIHPLHVPVIEASLTALTDIHGGCERIRSTPVPRSYTVLLHRIVAVYCGLLPFGMAETIGWATPVVVAFVSYALFGLDAIGDEIEQPFGLDPNDLPLSTISRMIEVNLKERLGEEPPPLFVPRGDILP